VTTDELRARLKKTATCVYIAVEKSVADDISDALLAAEAEIGKLALERSVKGVVVPRDLLVRADSYLSLLWHRPSTPHDTELSRAVNQTISELRRAYSDSPLDAERLRELIAQVESNQKHERHANSRETAYWCRQWRLLAEQFAAAVQAPRP
jgi:hypothetical protein